MKSFIDHLENCFAKAEKGESKITPEIIAMDGMTGTKTRHFYNNLLSMPDARYLEIGCWKGSSCCSAMYGNKGDFTMIDNFAGFGSPRNECLDNIRRFCNGNNWMFIEEDCFNVDLEKINTLSMPKIGFNIYLFDGDHSEESQKMALVFYKNYLAETFIYIADDWNWKTVRDGTMKGIDECNLEILYQKEIRLTNDDTHTPEPEASQGWWNGMSAFVLKKRI